MSQAVIDLAGRQYLVKVGDTITTNRHEDAKEGATIKLDEVLLTVDDKENAKIGTPFVKGASVTLKVKEIGKGEKLKIFRFKAKSRYRRRLGHRQPATTLEVTNISL